MTAELTPTTPTTTDRGLTAQQRMRIRTRLIDDLKSAHEQEAKLRQDIADGFESRRGSQNDEIDDPEGSNIAFEGAQSAAMLKQTIHHAEEIAAAIARIEDGSYGSCSHCGVTIAKGRLEARPSTAFCISCAA